MLGRSVLYTAGLCALASAQATRDVSVVDFAFTPTPLAVNMGDTVRWIWVSGTHTVTSGADSRAPSRPGALFDAPVTRNIPVFTWRVTYSGDAADGRIPYFCIPHESLGMRGTIQVNPVLSASGTPRVGSTVTFALNIPAEANRSYVMAASFSSSPGLPISGGRIVPLALDPLLLLSVGQNNPVFSGFIGVLDPAGRAVPAPFLGIPPVNGLIGHRLFFASVTVNPTAPGQIGSVSNSVSFQIQA